MLERAALEFVAEQAVQGAAKTVSIEGITYSADELKDPRRPMALPKPLEVATLGALADYCGVAATDDSIVHIVGPDTVEVISPLCGLDDSQRIVYCRARTSVEVFPFGKWCTSEYFITTIQARFAETPDRARILKLIGNIRNEAVRTEATDGVTQSVAVRSGVTLSADAKVINPFELAPFRTFAEVTQPASPFILRVRTTPGDGDGGVELSLHEADGGAWRLAAVKSIREWLVTTPNSTTAAPLTILA